MRRKPHSEAPRKRSRAAPSRSSAHPAVSQNLRVPTAGSVAHVDLLLSEVHDSIDRLKQLHAAMATLRADIEAEAAWLQGVFAAIERRPR